ncbi:FG-GAP-like repeat-containing protein [Streptomyces sp. NBC_01304]|uniref:FG-GAP-like repeat-containing protein n=1 Tax=Streptomyces sp. NBC_01304 TaxID=2903818 RepID=UPI002E1309DC|nr:FG-GAP-like repeat-containing protein [Streptomyces sp. NBC_01304]
MSPRAERTKRNRSTKHAYQPLSLKRRAWLTIGAVVLGGAGAVTYATAGQSDSTDAAGERTKRPAEVHDIALKADGSDERELPRTGTELFSLLGVSWDGAKKELDGTAQVRTRSVETGQWSGWQGLDLELHLPEEGVAPAGLRAASEPLWVGPSDGVEVQVVAADGTASAALPKGLEVNLVDPGVTAKEAANPALKEGTTPAAYPAEPVAYAEEETPTPTPDPGTSTPQEPPSGPETPPTGDPATSSPAPSDSGTPTASPSPTPTKPVPLPSTVKRPPITSRAAWGADESIVDDPAEYIDKVQAVFIHHTVGANNYSCAESASLVRGVMEYHVNVNKWNDLGYNFLVDKCGQIFEGRGGGADLPVKGAHTVGYNSYSTGIALLGDFEGDAAQNIPAGKPTRAALESASRVAAWKLGQYAGDPKGKVTLQQILTDANGDPHNGELKSFNVISGHKDGYATQCPGANLYSKLGTIRDLTASPLKNAAAATADFNRDGINDMVAGTPKASGSAGSLTVVPGGLNGPVAGSKKTITQSSPDVPGANEAGDNFGASNAWGDINGDGYADLAIGVPGEDDTSGHADRGAVTILYGPALNTGTSYTLDDGFHATGGKFGSTVAVADFNSDGKADVFTVAPGTGGSWDVRTSDTSSMGGALTGSSGALQSVDSATGDFNKDGYADVALNYRDPAGKGYVTWFKGSRSGLSKQGVLSGVKGGRSITAGDFNGNGFDDIVIGQPYASESAGNSGGQVVMLPGTATGFTTTGMRTVTQSTAGVPGASESGDGFGYSVSAGDFNADGRADLLVGGPGEDITRTTSRKDAGATWLLKSDSGGITGTSSRDFSQDTAGIPGSTEAGDRFGSSVTLSDLSGYGRADVAIGADGEDAGNGTILQLDSTSSGISLTNPVYYSSSVLKTPAGARLGQTLAP